MSTTHTTNPSHDDDQLGYQPIQHLKSASGASACAAYTTPGDHEAARQLTNRHLPGLTGAAAVTTDAFTLAQRSLGRVVAANGIAAISGRPGNGKTFTVNDFLHHHPTAVHRQKFWLDMPPRPGTKEVTMRLLRLLGVRFNPRDAQYVLSEELIPHLLGRRIILTIDEAHNLGRAGLQQLRYLHDRCQPLNPGDPGGFAMLLIGSDVDRALAGAAELGSRVTTWIEFAPLDREDMVLAVRSWHPLLKAVPVETLLQVDQRFGRGTWRRWAQLLAALIEVHGRAERRSARTGDPMPDPAALVQAALAAVGQSKR